MPMLRLRSSVIAVVLACGVLRVSAAPDNLEARALRWALTHGLRTP